MRVEFQQEGKSKKYNHSLRMKTIDRNNLNISQLFEFEFLYLSFYRNIEEISCRIWNSMWQQNVIMPQISNRYSLFSSSKALISWGKAPTHQNSNKKFLPHVELSRTQLISNLQIWKIWLFFQCTNSKRSHQPVLI